MFEIYIEFKYAYDFYPGAEERYMIGTGAAALILLLNEETHIQYYLKLKYLVPLCDTSSAYFCYDTPLASDLKV